MQLHGCSNPGFSYTNTYLENIVDADLWMQQNIDREISYEEMQNEIDKLDLSLKSSALRMLVPFLVKAGVVNPDNFSKKRQFLDLKNFYTGMGRCFIDFLHAYVKVIKLENSEELESRKQLNIMFEKFGFLQYIELLQSEDDIYTQIFKYLQKFKTIDKHEFFLLTTFRPKRDDKIDEEFENIIRDKRQGNNPDYEIVKHVNSYNYICRLLSSMGVLRPMEKCFVLNEDYSEYIQEIKNMIGE